MEQIVSGDYVSYLSMYMTVNIKIPSEYQRQGQEADTKYRAAQAKVTELQVELGNSQRTLRELDVSIAHAVMVADAI